MAQSRKTNITHKNNLSGYIGNWLTVMNHIKKTQPPIRISRAVVSYNDNMYDLSLMLSYLDNNLTLLEETPSTSDKFDHLAYAQARAFLKVCYLLLRILLDDVSGVIKYFYDYNERKVGVPESFNDLLNKADNRKLPEDLIEVLQQSKKWFRQMRDRKDDLAHRHESLLISLRQGRDGKNTLGHFSTMGHTAKEYEDIRKCFGFVLCEYQKLIDNLLDHFDSKFRNWYAITPHRNITIFDRIVDMPLWWAYKYGNYRHKDLHIIKNNDGEAV
ncbi:MAG: hypothetical protein GWP14_03675 [Actinobacteria bacterium]|nr:hypothetical protein [Actinomycetota bacterium]